MCTGSVGAFMKDPSPACVLCVCWLIGPSARKLRAGGVDPLGSRAVQRALHPFMG